MGLGPPVCEDCVVLMEYNEYDAPLLPSGYFCPMCGSTNINRHAGIGPESSYQLYEDNLRLLMFMKGYSNGDE